MWQAASTIFGQLVALTALGFAYFQWRRAQLRRDDVLRWANQAIASLEALFLVSKLNEPLLDKEMARVKLVDIAFETATLVEQGRLFFKNVSGVGQHDLDKPSAYRGYRPAILDPLVVAHQISCELLEAKGDERLCLRALAEDCLKKFVSLAQKEVGRLRAAAVEPKVAGEGLHLGDLLHQIDSRQLATLRNEPSSYLERN